MEDRYLFKAKRLDNREWVTGQYVKGLDMCDKEVHLIFEPTTIFYSSGETDGWSEIDPSTLCQCTGLYGVLRTLKLKLSATYLTIRSWRKGNEYETNIV